MARVRAEEAFIVTVGVPHTNRNRFCERALKALADAGFAAGPTSDESIATLYRQMMLTAQLAENDDPVDKLLDGLPEGGDATGESRCPACGGNGVRCCEFGADH